MLPRKVRTDVCHGGGTPLLYDLCRFGQSLRPRLPGPRVVDEARETPLRCVDRASSHEGQHSGPAVQACIVGRAAPLFCSVHRGAFREKYELLLRMEAERWQARLDPIFQDPQAWASMSIEGIFD